MLREVVLVSLLLVPPAAAQVQHGLHLDADDIPSPIAVDVERAPLNVTWTYSCEPGGTETPSAQGTTIHFNVSAPHGIHVAGRLSEDVPPPACGTDASQGTAEFFVQADADAPGLAPLPIRIDASVTSDSPRPSTVEATVTREVVVAFTGLLGAKVPSTIQQGGPGSTSSYDVEVVNLGNARSRMVFTTDVGGFVLPEPPVLDADRSAVVQVTYRHPDEAGFDNDERTAAITITPVSEMSAEEGTPVTVNLLARTRSDLMAPGPGPWAAIALVAAAAVARRFR